MTVASLFFSVVVTVMGPACAEIGVAQSSARQMRVCSLQSGDREVHFFFIGRVAEEGPFYSKRVEGVEIFFCPFGTPGGRALPIIIDARRQFRLRDFLRLDLIGPEKLPRGDRVDCD
jgi:hypothetical protein